MLKIIKLLTIFLNINIIGMESAIKIEHAPSQDNVEIKMRFYKNNIQDEIKTNNIKINKSDNRYYIKKNFTNIQNKTFEILDINNNTNMNMENFSNLFIYLKDELNKLNINENLSLEFLNCKKYYFEEQYLKFNVEICIKYNNQLIPIIDMIVNININNNNNEKIFSNIISILNANSLEKKTYENSYLNEILIQPTQNISYPITELKIYIDDENNFKPTLNFIENDLPKYPNLKQLNIHSRIFLNSEENEDEIKFNNFYPFYKNIPDNIRIKILNGPVGYKDFKISEDILNKIYTYNVHKNLIINNIGVLNMLEIKNTIIKYAQNKNIQIPHIPMTDKISELTAIIFPYDNNDSNIHIDNLEIDNNKIIETQHNILNLIIINEF